MSRKIYIAGPMTGYKDFNRPAFKAFAFKLSLDGNVVLNPAVLPDGLEQREYMDIRYAPHEIAGFMFDGGQWVNAADIPRPGSYEVRCNKCKSNDWTENGRFINEYECGCCGAFITVEPKNEWQN